MGHTHLEHGNGKHEPESMEWGEWMLAPRPGMQVQRDHGSNKGLKEVDMNRNLKNMKDGLVEVPSSRKRLNNDIVVSDPMSNQLGTLQAATDIEGGATTMEIQNHALVGTEVEDDDTSAHDLKRSKKDNTAVMDASHQISASSEQELDRTQ